MSHKSKSIRSRRGSMLLLCIAAGALLLCACGVGFWTLSLLFSRDEVQNRAGSEALFAAQILNAHDYSGRMNNFIAHSRELVFDSRRMCKQIESDDELAELQPLAQQLMKESRDSAIFVEKEKNQLAASTLQQLKLSVAAQNEHPFRAVSMLDSAPQTTQISDIEVGTLSSLESNVEPLDAVKDLVDTDMSRGYIQKNLFLKVYKAASNLKLPAPDDDLKFELSPLPAPVDNTTAPSRLIGPDRFKKLQSIRKNGIDTSESFSVIPCAVQIVTTLPVQEQLVGKLKSSVGCTNAACANGASPEQ